jgi:uncharacterized protein YegP (UPF0339 family)
MARKKKEAAATRAGLEFYRDSNNQFRWRLRAANGNVVGESGEGYRRVADAERGFNSLREAIIALPGPAASVSVTPRKPRKAPADTAIESAVKVAEVARQAAFE